MKKISLLAALVLGCLCWAAWVAPAPQKADWGFFGHKRINRLAIFTLPPSIFGFYKEHVEYITEHAVDPDKRRYATKHEAVRHYMDLDHWGTYPYEDLPRDFAEAVKKELAWYYISAANDTIQLTAQPDAENLEIINISGKRKEFQLNTFSFDKFYRSKIFNFTNYYEAPWSFPVSDLKGNWNLEFPWTTGTIYFEDKLSEGGILPYHLLDMQNRLRGAFRGRDLKSILRLSADFGHYIGDAHVPLHTTSNYNGQLTNQLGIHAFWESRIPELLADTDWEFFVGPSKYIEEPAEYFWDIVLASNQLVDSVLNIEKRLSLEFPEDAQFCQDLRNGNPVRTQCADYTRAYDAAMGGMVEERMKSSILAIGSCWYTAWIDGGRPNLDSLLLGDALPEVEETIKPVLQPGRAHEN